MPYKTISGSHYHITEGCHGADIPCDTTGLEPCSDCCMSHNHADTDVPRQSRLMRGSAISAGSPGHCADVSAQSSGDAEDILLEQAFPSPDIEDDATIMEIESDVLQRISESVNVFDTSNQMPQNGGKSQRQDGFRGGIQQGTSATTSESASLDKGPRDYVDAHDFGDAWRSTLDSDALKEAFGSKLKSPIAGFQPDGGIFLSKEGKPEVVFESKHQGERGNALERWYKNFAIAKRLGCKRYVTFCSGDGFFDNNSGVRQIGDIVAIEDPLREDLWEDNNSALVFYRFRTSQEALKQMSDIMTDNLQRFWSQSDEFDL